MSDNSKDLHDADLPDLIRQLFTYVDAKGHPTTEYDVLVPIPASLLQQLRAALEQTCNE